MERKGNISDYRRRLDKTLASPDLTNNETIHTLVKNQILHSSDSQLEECSEYVVERRSKEISNFLNMLRSASMSDVEGSKSSNESHGGWKVKQDTEEFRVMYREGPAGTPFHTLLVEGYVDGPLDVCLCISCEADLYKKWWPQIAIPTFKVISSQYVQRIRIGEGISLVRIKFSWPLSSREVLVHCFAFEYFQDGLIVVLLNTISDSEAINRHTHGFTRDGIPDAHDVVRIDLVGGFALQKVTADRSYFRTIANLDIKLDFVPAAFINFVSRQLLGSGFKLYKKEVASVAKGDEKFLEALKDPLYTSIRQALYSENTATASPALQNLRSASILLEGQSMEAFEDSNAIVNNECDGCVIHSEAKDTGFTDRKVLNEIEEFKEKDIEGSESLDTSTHKSCDNLTMGITKEARTDKKEVVICTTEVEQAVTTTNKITEHFAPEIRKKVGISSEVQQALGTLEKAISVLRECNNFPGKGQSDVNKGRLTNLEEDAGKEAISPEADQVRRKNGTCGESSIIGSTEFTSHESRNSLDNHGSSEKGSNSCTREANQSKIAPVSPDEDCSSLSLIKHNDFHSSLNQTTLSTLFKNTTQNNSLSSDADSSNGNRVTKRKNKKPRFCCLHFIS